jgi:proliferating cell nuclear antigen
MSFYAKVKDIVHFRKILMRFKQMKKKFVTFDATRAGIATSGMDSSHVMLIELRLFKSYFEEYKCDSAISFCIDVYRTLECVIPHFKGSLIMEIKEPGDDTMYLTVSSLTFLIKLEEVEGEDLQPPEGEYNVVLKIQSNKFSKNFNDLCKVGDYIEFMCEKSAIKFRVREQNETREFMICKGRDRIKKLEGTPFDVSYPTKYLQIIRKCSGVSKEVTLNFSKETPLLVEFDIDGDGYVRFYLAPRID